MARRVLIADDNPDVSASLRMLLEVLGHEVEVADNGHECLCMLRDRPRFDLLLLDMLMPGTDGREVLDNLPAAAPPIILLTGAPDLVPVPPPPGVRHVLVKAAPPADLIAKVNDVLGGQS